MGTIFVVADTHFSHKGILAREPANRPFASLVQHDEALIDRWNATVRKHDTVWHLGDVLFARGAFVHLARLKGVKKLVMGTHDCYPARLYLEHFAELAGAVQLKGCLLTHLPIRLSEMKRFRGNVHGHMHSRRIDDPRYQCVSVEQTGLTPIPLDLVLARMPPVEG